MCAADVVVNVSASFSCFMRLRIGLGRPGSSMGLTRNTTDVGPRTQAFRSPRFSCIYQLYEH